MQCTCCSTESCRRPVLTIRRCSMCPSMNTDTLKTLKPALAGKPPTEIPIFAKTFHRGTPAGGSGPVNGSGIPDAGYAAAQAAFEAMFPISPADRPNGSWRTKWGYLDLRGYVGNVGNVARQTPQCVARGTPDRDCSETTADHAFGGKPTSTLREVLQGYIDDGVGDKIHVIKLGDEIALNRPTGNSSAVDPPYHAWAHARGLTPRNIGCAAFDATCHYNVSEVLAVSLGRFAFSCARRCRSSADPCTLSRACMCVRASVRPSVRPSVRGVGWLPMCRRPIPLSSITVRCTQTTSASTVTTRTQRHSSLGCYRMRSLAPTTLQSHAEYPGRRAWHIFPKRSNGFGPFERGHSLFRLPKTTSGSSHRDPSRCTHSS